MEVNDSVDPVAAAMEEVRGELRRRRERGELPELPPEELERQFTGVVEAVEAGLVEHPPLDPGDLTGPAVLESWRPFRGRGGPVGRLLDLALSPLTRVVGVFVRRQVGEFSMRTALVVEELALRQNRTSTFLSRAFLDRQRRLEYRVAQLELEVERLRAEAGSDSSVDDVPAPAD